MLNTARNGGEHADYSPVIMPGSPTGYYVVIFGGATQTGKSSRADALVGRQQKDFVYGPKGKMRPEGVKKEGDDERPDSILLTPQKLARLRSKGLVLEGADYSHERTRYYPLMGFPDKGYSAIPKDHHVIYVSLTHEGAMRTREALSEYNPLTFLLYTRLETLRKRLDASKMSEAEKATRLQAYRRDFAQFRDSTDNYLFLMHVKSPIIPEDLFRDESAKQRAKGEVQRDADEIRRLIAKFGDVFQPQMSYYDIHDTFIEKRVIQELFNTNLDNLARRLNSNGEVRLDVGKQMEAHMTAGNYLADREKEYLANIHPLGLITANGRHTLLLRGFDEWQATINGHRPLEDILLDFIESKLGEKPTVREQIKGQNPSSYSNLGLVKVVTDASLRDGVTYSLGNTHLVDNTHPSFSVVFVYPRRDDIDLRRAVVGMDSLEVKNLEDEIIQ